MITKSMQVNQVNGLALLNLNNILKSKKKRRIVIASILLILWWFSIPSTLFQTPYSSVLESRNHELLAAKIADDGQWRFPLADSVPYKFEQCITYFEDEYFRYHIGVNPVSIARAAYQNISQQKVVSGGSTLTMQVVRLSRNNPSRSLWEKFLELFRATRMEVRYSKDEILGLYAAHAPFGGNVVGLETAAWRYYKRKPHELSWGEMATLAVLPNAPALIYPGKNHELLLEKRNRLLDKLKEAEVIDEVSCELAKEEPLPQKPHPLPQTAIHLLERLIQQKGSGKRYISTLDFSLQNKLEKVAYHYQQKLSENEIHNGALLVTNIETGEILTYIGNINSSQRKHHKDVNIIHAPRSSGSILKPLMYINMINEGYLNPHMKLLDIPTSYGNYRPKNYNKAYDGLVDASEALARSLNVTAVRQLKRYGTENLLYQLREMGLTTLNKSPEHYGLSLILGGGEVNLWDMTNLYGRLAQRIENPINHEQHYLMLDSNQVNNKLESINPSSIYETFEALLKLNRPTEEEGWDNYEGLSHVAWKTGTSFGHRDAWAIGITGKYVVGVWIGNADGEGRPAITGVKSAAPLLFQTIRMLPQSKWLEAPIKTGSKVQICKESGYLANIHCPNTFEDILISNNSNTPNCPYHQLIHLSKDEEYLVSMDCFDPNEITTVPWFAIPPTAEWYYRKKNIHFKPLPKKHPKCYGSEKLKQIEIIYPNPNSRIKIPKELSGKKGKLILQASHRSKETEVHWHLNNEYMGSSKDLHQLSIQPQPGKYLLTLVDSDGEEESIRFEILE